MRGKLTVKVTKLTKETCNLSTKYTEEKGEDRPGMIIIIKVTTILEIDPLVEIEGYHTEVEFDKIMARILGRIIVGDHKTITEMNLGEKIIEVKIIEIEVEVETIAGTIIGMTIDRTIHFAETEAGQ